jgi:hypothetical protein
MRAMSHEVSAPAMEEGSAVEYRADYSDARSYTPLDPTYGSLEEAQECCEKALRGAREDGEALVISWRANTDTDDAVLWDMLVVTPLLRTPVSTGYSVTVVGSVFDAPEITTAGE